MLIWWYYGWHKPWRLLDISLKHSCTHTLKILMSLSQTGWNHVYKFLFLVTYMGPSSSSRFVHCITSWFTLLHHPVKSLVQHLTSYPSKYTNCLLFVILINIRPSIFYILGLNCPYNYYKSQPVAIPLFTGALSYKFLCSHRHSSYKFHVRIFNQNGAFTSQYTILLYTQSLIISIQRVEILRMVAPTTPSSYHCKIWYSHREGQCAQYYAQ